MFLVGISLLAADGSSTPATAAVKPVPQKEASEPAPVVQTPKQKALEDFLQRPFAYRRENRPDPFMPFLTEDTGPTQVQVEEDTPLTGMQLYEPGQLTLVAILFSGQEAIAMVEDSTGMGHIIKASDKIGRRGEVKEILPNSVVIEETSLTTGGSKRHTTNEMVLRKEGEKE